MSALDDSVAFLSSLDGNGALLNSDGTIVAVNEAWSRFGDENGASSSVGVGVNYLDVCRTAAARSATAKRALDGLLSVLDGTSPIFRCDYKCNAPDRPRWFRLVVTPWHIPGARVLVLHQDISELKQMQERLRILSQRILKAQDEERSHIGRELHDDIGQRLSFVSMDLARIEIRDASVAGLRGAIAQAKTQIFEITRDISALAHGLHSRVLDSRGLVAACDELCAEVAARRNVTVNFRSERVPEKMPNELGRGVFRVLQEAVQNAVKYSGAKAIEVTLSASSNLIELSVKDDGRGFDLQKAMEGKGLGLTSMGERVKLLRGKFRIDTGRSGTAISARIPFNSPIEAYVKAKKSRKAGS